MHLLTPQRRLLLLVCALLMPALIMGCTLNNLGGGGGAAVSGAPGVRIILPQPNATYFTGVAVNIQAAVSNAGSDIDRVEIVVDGTIIATLTEVNPNNAATFNVSQGWSATSVGAHSISVIAYRADGSSSEPASVEINVMARGDATPTTQASPAATTQQQNAPQNTQSSGSDTSGSQSSAADAPTSAPNTSAPEPTANTSGNPTASFAQGINVRRGPSTAFNPPIGAFASGQTTEILAMNNDGTWYKVRYGGGEGWVSAALTTASGDVASLPRESGPPVPTAAPPTAIPPTSPPAATPAPASSANLVAGIVEITPGQPTCQQTFNIGLDVANLGSQPTSASSTISVNDVRSADGSSQQTTIGGFPVIQPGQTVRIDMPLTVSTWYNEEHTIILIIDPNNEIPESEEGDNRREVRYTLQQGGC
jgi:uncharacterized protein YraI